MSNPFRLLTLTLMAIVSLLFAGIAACTDGAPVQRNGRILAIDVNMPEHSDYVMAFKVAKSIGMQDVGLSLDWRDLETTALHYDYQWPTIANAFYPAANTSVSLTIRPIHTNRKVVPEYLMKTPMNDPEMISRFNDLLDAVLAKMPDVDISSLVIGSEIDIYLGKDAKQWKEYQEFFEAVRGHVKKRYPDLKVGTEAKLEGLTGDSKKHLLELNKHADFIGASYYPLNADFYVKDPSVVRKDFKALVSVYPKTPIRFFQYGYPSSPRLKSSEAKQREFIRNTFKAWDEYAKQIEMIDFTWLHDLPKATLDAHAKYYGLSDPNFLAFLQTLGLRTYPGDGIDKEAFRALRAEAKARGW